MIELFARKPDLIKEIPGMHLTDIPTGEEASSLSAILKAKAFLNNRARREAGQEVREDDITKHKKDVIRLTATLTPATRVKAPDIIKSDLRQYVEIIRTEDPDVRQMLKNQ